MQSEKITAVQMMPTVPPKSEAAKALPKAFDVSKAYLNIVDKKVRNMEKRRARLESIKQKAAAGGSLEKEQKQTLMFYDGVLATLDFSKDLQKTFISTSHEIDRQLKKQHKREKQERAAGELKRTADILQIQATLDALGNCNVRRDFMTGRNGAIQLSEQALDSIDELYALITPPVAGEKKFATKVVAASEHLSQLVEGRDKPVAGSTYREMLEMLQDISLCGYFERAQGTIKDKDEKEDEGGDKMANARALDCATAGDGHYEVGCRTFTTCSGGQATVTECHDGKVYNSDLHICDDPHNVKPPCGVMKDCSTFPDGRYADLDNQCHSYYTCVGGTFVGHNFCPGSLVYSPVTKQCDWSSNVPPPCGTHTGP